MYTSEVIYYTYQQHQQSILMHVASTNQSNIFIFIITITITVTCVYFCDSYTCFLAVQVQTIYLNMHGIRIFICCSTVISSQPERSEYRRSKYQNLSPWAGCPMIGMLFENTGVMNAGDIIEDTSMTAVEKPLPRTFSHSINPYNQSLN